ncbi:MAG: PEP/pyruvate-binding domain-containing protein [Myxococcales bacterium]
MSIVSLEAAAESAAKVGGKAANLARLMAAGFEVPAGFVVTADAFAAHLAQPEIELALRSVREATGPKREALARARAAIEASRVEPTLEEALGAALRSLGDGLPVAVRSSAAAEDSAACSFAGLHETVLGVRGLAECVEALKRCWASAWTERAFEYRSQAGLGDAAASMAVVVQRLVQAEYAGVLFTRDPTGVAGTDLVCEAVAGLGEGLVSGRLAPSRWTISRATLEVAQTSEGEGKGFDPAMVERIARTGLQIEQAGGAPQDIEWAVVGGELKILQARPITTTLAAATPGGREDRIVWANTNLGEALAGRDDAAVMGHRAALRRRPAPLAGGAARLGPEKAAAGRARRGAGVREHELGRGALPAHPGHGPQELRGLLRR